MPIGKDPGADVLSLVPPGVMAPGELITAGVPAATGGGSPNSKRS
jgi:hypothetical protein